MTPDDVQALKAELSSQRSAAFEIMLGGRRRGADWEQERTLIRSLAEAGETWLGEYLEPADLEDVQACIERVKQGPLRV